MKLINMMYKAHESYGSMGDKHQGHQETSQRSKFGKRPRLCPSCCSALLGAPWDVAAIDRANHCFNR